MNILKCTAEEAREIVYEENDDFEIINDDIIANNRWSIIHEVVVLEKETGVFYSTCYTVGATENQEEQPFEYSDPDFKEVFPAKITTTVYVSEEEQ